MAEQSEGSSSFVKAFIPGLVVGLIIGLAIGVVSGPLLLDRVPAASKPTTGTPRTPASERDPHPKQTHRLHSCSPTAAITASPAASNVALDGIMLPDLQNFVATLSCPAPTNRAVRSARFAILHGRAKVPSR